MVNPFEQTPAEKEQYVLDMLERGYSYPQIMKECHVSPNTISSVKKKIFGTTDDNNSIQPSQTSKETQALKLFKEGWKPLDIAIELDLEPDSVFQIQKKFYQLIGLDEFNQAYEQVDGNIFPFLELFNSMNRLGMNLIQILNAVKYANALPQLQNIYTMLGNEVRLLESYRHNLHSQLNAMTSQIEGYKNSLDYCINEFEQKRNGLLALDYQTKNMQNFIQEFDNQEGYQRIKKETTEQTKSIIKNNHLLLSVTISSTLEAIRRYPYNQQLLYDLSASLPYSTSNQQIWMQSHTTHLLQLSEQVQTEIAEQITKMVISKIQDKNYESGVSTLQG